MSGLIAQESKALGKQKAVLIGGREGAGRVVKESQTTFLSGRLLKFRENCRFFTLVHEIQSKITSRLSC